MSDPHGDFDFDEDGIYREKTSDTGMLVDEDGIWRDDLDSLYTYRTDSGIGTRKSSELGKFRGEIDRDFNALYEDYRDRESCSTDRKCVNISEFEASESAAGEDISFEDRSLGSDDNIEFPELNDESYDDFLGDGEPLRYLTRPGKRKVAGQVKDGIQSVAMEMPEVTGDSIFTQQEELDSRGGLGHSLAEFEHLEAQIEQDSGDNVDLIGAYLKDLKYEEDDDEESEFGENPQDVITSIAFEESTANEPPRSSINFCSSEFGESPLPASLVKSPSPSEKLKHRVHSPTRAMKAFPQPISSESPRLSLNERNRCLPATPLISSRSKSQLQLSSAGDASPPPRPSSAGIPRTSGMDFMPDYRRPYTPQASGDFIDLSRVNLSELRMSIEDSDLSNAEKAHELKALFLQEVQQRRLNDETYTQLQIEYNSLLKKYAEAENTIDELRLGAKVTLFSDSPVPQTASSASTQQQAKFTHASLSSLVMGKNSASAPSSAQVSASRPASSASLTSGSVFVPNVDQPSEPTESASTVEDTAKLAIMVKSKSVEDQINAFQILLSEKHLSLEDQEKALGNIKKTFEDLRHQHREAKDEHEFLRRQGLTPGGASESSVIGGFDESKDLEGAIYKLSMKLDDVDHRVQENLKERTKRKPYQGGPQPVRGDHSIAIPPVENKRPSSVDSISPEIDRKMQRLLKEYDHLMRRYQGLKQMNQTPHRDEEINRLVQDLKDIYDQAPDRNKPTVPEELATRVTGRRRSHTSPLSDRRSPHDRRSRSSEGSRRSPQAFHLPKADHHDDSYHSDASFNGRGSKASIRSREERSSDYTSGMSRPASDHRLRGRRELPDTTDKKAPQKPLRQAFPTRSAGHRRLPKVTGQRLNGTKENWKVSTKPAQRSSRVAGNDRGYVRTDALSPLNGEYSCSDSDSSADSVVECSRRNGSSHSQRDFSGESRSSVDSFDDHRGRHGRAVYGSLSESDSDEALSLEGSFHRRDHLHPKRVPVTAEHRATRGAVPHQSRSSHQTQSRAGRSLSPPQYDQVYKHAKQQASGSPHSRGSRRHLEYADGYEEKRSPEVQLMLQPSSSKMRRYPSMPNLTHDSGLSQAPMYYTTQPYDDVERPYAAYEPEVQYVNPDIVYDANGQAPYGYEPPPLVPVDDAAANGVYLDQYGTRQARFVQPHYDSEPVKYSSGRARHRSGQTPYGAGPGQAPYDSAAARYVSEPTQFVSGQAPYVSEVAQYGPGQAPYVSEPTQYGAGPAQYSSDPAQYRPGQAQYSSNPAQYGSSPAQIASGSAQHGQTQYISEPTQYGSRPTQYIAGRPGQAVLSTGANQHRVLHPGVKAARVRYYVREYRPPNSASDESDDPDLSMTIRSALKTAKHLQAVSQRMKSKLKTQLIRSCSESNLLF